MKLITFSQNGLIKVGAILNEEIVDLSALVKDEPWNLIRLIENTESLKFARELLNNPKKTIKLGEVALEAPILRPRKFLGLGMNYKRHVEELKDKGFKTSDYQVWFNKQVSCVNGPFSPIEKPRVSDALDYEGELAFVIGQRCRHVKAEDASSVIAGYMIANDVSVRDWQLHSATWTIGKSFDTHGPIGPALVTPDEIEDPHNLDIRLYVNDEIRQDSNTSDMIYSCFDMVEYLSTVFTLEPGDIFATGTPEGVGTGFNPPKFLRVGDTVRCEIEGLGAIENEVIAEQ
jgi:2-keto-4-pentenoate hydratase/2-oxohepta-3-ene-1,7-dioic acid hydratase in catechol pathway